MALLRHTRAQYVLCQSILRGGLFGVIASPLAGAALSAMICVGSLQHAVVLQGVRGVESINRLQGHLTDAGRNWLGAGKVLGQLFDQDAPRTVIATTAAGAIPFFAGLETVDMLGLNDVWVAHHGLAIGSVPGHQRRATATYLLERRVKLVIGHPWVRQASSYPRQRRCWRFPWMEASC